MISPLNGFDIKETTKSESINDKITPNLEWLSYYDNNHHGTAIERRSITRGKKVLQYSLDGEFIKEWNSAREIERELGNCIYHNCRHIAEPECGVIKALNEGKISQLRYESYKSQLQEIRKSKQY